MDTAVIILKENGIEPNSDIIGKIEDIYHSSTNRDEYFQGVMRILADKVKAQLTEMQESKDQMRRT
jgi:hypothetical protein